MISSDQLTDPTVRTLVVAINAGDRDEFLAAFSSEPTMSDDGTDRDFYEWIDKEIFDADGHMVVESQSDDGRSLVARYRNSTYGEMRTSWTFVVDEDGWVSRLETAQA